MSIYVNMDILLPEILKNRPFSAKEAKECGITRYQINQLLKSDTIHLIERGIYRYGESDYSIEEQFKTATIKAGKPSCVCLLSALIYHDLCDEILDKIWIMVPQKKRISDNQLRVYRSSKPYWNIGIIIHRDFSITTVERTIVDCLIKKNWLGYPIAIEGLRRALNQKKIKLDEIYKVAKLLKVDSRIIPYIEAFS